MKKKNIGRDSVKVNNEINIKINNSNDKRTGRQTNRQIKNNEEDALNKLSNMEYDNNAILMSQGQGNTRGSGGSILLPSRNVDPNYNSYSQLSQNNLVNNALQSRGAFLKPTETNEPTPSRTFQSIVNEAKPQTATVEFLDDEGYLITDSKEFRDLPASEQLLLIKDAEKRGKKGRPKGSKNKPKPTISIPIPQQEQPKPFQSQFDTTGASAIFENEKEQTLKTGDFKKSNPYTEHLNEKLTMNQTPSRPDRNVDIKTNEPIVEEPAESAKKKNEKIKNPTDDNITVDVLIELLYNSKFEKFFNALSNYKNYGNFVKEVCEFLENYTGSNSVNPFDLFSTKDSKKLLQELFNEYSFLQGNRNGKTISWSAGLDAGDRIYEAMVYLMKKCKQIKKLDNRPDNRTHTIEDAAYALRESYTKSKINTRVKPEPKKEEPKPVVKPEIKKTEPKKEEPKPEPKKTESKNTIIISKNPTPEQELAQALLDENYGLFSTLLKQDKQLSEFFDWLTNKIKSFKRKGSGYIVGADLFFAPYSKKLLNNLFDILRKYMRPVVAVIEINNGMVRLIEDFGGNPPELNDISLIIAYTKRMTQRNATIFNKDRLDATNASSKELFDKVVNDKYNQKLSMFKK